MKAKQLSRRTRLRRALERWENEGGSVVVKPDQTLGSNESGEINTIRTKRAYEPPGPKDGKRFLVDALWPRGVKQDALRIEDWKKESAPSKRLRQWFGHDPSKWREFQQRYFAELRERPQNWRPLLEEARRGKVTLVFGAKDTEHNNAVALKSFLERKL